MPTGVPVLETTASRYTRPHQNAAPSCIQLPALHLFAGQKIGLSGPSGVGKTTFLHLIFGLLPSVAGLIKIGGSDPHTRTPHARLQWRTQHMGFLAQSPQVLPTLTVIDNLQAATWAAHTRFSGVQAHALLDELGIADLSKRTMAQLSRGQMQRVALVRAAMLRPSLLLADEPTANLDDVATQQVLTFLTRLSHEGVAILMASHDHRIAPWADAAVPMQHGGSHVD